tara:strand:+ start:55548 stop:56165 length:618 start_codon:yes stop_codon:yes gene_type:complete
LLDIWLERLIVSGIERILINTHYLPEVVESYVESSDWRNMVDTTYETVLLGTAGTLVANAEYFGGNEYLLAHADNLTDFDLPAFKAAFDARPADCAIAMLTFRTDNPSSCGILELDENGVVQAFHEKVDNPPGNLANAAVYIMTSEVLEFARSLNQPILDLSTEVIPHFLGRIIAVENGAYHRDIGTVESLQKAHQEYRPTWTVT